MNILLHLTNPADQILPRLWLGSQLALNPAFLKEKHIDAIINMTPDVPIPAGIYGVRFPVYDHPSYEKRLHQMMPSVLKLLHKLLYNGHTVLIHCQAGIQRSATVVACYLKTYYKFSPWASIMHIRSRRKIAFFNGFTFKHIVLS